MHIIIVQIVEAHQSNCTINFQKFTTYGKITIQWDKFQKEKKDKICNSCIKKKCVYKSKMLNSNTCFSESKQKQDYNITVNR